MTMYKVIKPLGGYGYQVGEITSQIREEDVPKFLKHGLLMKVEDQPTEKPAAQPAKQEKKGTKPKKS